MASNYNTIGNQSPYGSGDPYYNESSGYITPAPVKKRTSNWIKFGIPVLILVIIGAVVGGVVGSRSKSNNSSGTSSGGSGGDAAASSAASIKLNIGRFATATDSEYMMPIYPSTVSHYPIHGQCQSSVSLYRRTQQPSHHLHLFLPQSLGCRGPKIRSSRQIQTCLPSDLIVLVSSPLRTNGRHCLR